MEFWHVLNRGVEKRTIAQDDRDRKRFVHSLYYMNDTRSAKNDERDRSVSEMSTELDDRKRLVTVHAWCLMGNHYHLLLSDYTEGGISEFTRKLSIGYTHYFNLKYERSGVLFQGRTKKVPITTDRQFLYIMPYIHLNPLDFHKETHGWRRQCVAKPTSALGHITAYRWSSYRNYSGESEFSPILAGSELYVDREAHVQTLNHFLRQAPEPDIDKLALE